MSSIFYVEGKGRKKNIPIRNWEGTRFGRLIAKAFIGMREYPSGGRKAIWKCLCDCGKETEVIVSALISGGTQSCGCLHKETSAENGRNSRDKIRKQNASLTSLYSVYKSNAKKRDLSFELSLEEFQKLTSSSCHYCGVSPSNSHVASSNTIEYKYNGVDRADNTLGYTAENSVPCCSMCNHAKATHDASYFINWAKQVAKHSEKKELPEGQREEDSITNSVIEDLRQREKDGYRSYGRFLTKGSPEDMMSELYNEIQDAALYLKNRMLQEKASKSYRGIKQEVA